MKNTSENLSHLYAEGIDRFGGSEEAYPDIVGYAVGHLDMMPADFESADHDNSVLHLYRGDSRENLEELKVDLEGPKATGDLSRGFPSLLYDF